MRFWLRGLVHVRHLAALPALTLLMLVATWQFYEIHIRVQVDIDELARPVGAPEIFGGVLAAMLPALCAPVFNGREALAARRARWTHTLVSVVVLLVPLLVLVTWHLSVRWHEPSQVLPPAHDFAGNMLLVASIGLVATLLVGPQLGPVVTIGLYAGFVVAQQLWPGSPLGTEFSLARHWHTNWWLTIAIVAVAVALAHRLRSVPRPVRRFS